MALSGGTEQEISLSREVRAARRCRRGTGVRGYTFLEMMITVVIIGIVGAFVAPNAIGYVRHMQLVGAANTVKRQLQLARMKALADPYKHCGVSFKLSPVGQQYTKMFLDVGTTPNKLDSADAPYLKPQGIPAGVTMSFAAAPPESVIVFRGDGSAKYAGAVRLVAGKDTIVVSVLASTGRIRINK